MITIISPSKGQDFSKDAPSTDHSQPRFLEQSSQLIKQLRQLSAAQLQEVMVISEKLASLNCERYQAFSPPFDLNNAKQALFAFRGDVYKPIDWPSYHKAELEFAQHHLRIISGLYGCLRPLDLIQPYRLEMKTKLQTGSAENLYQFWQGQLSDSLTKELAVDPVPTLINLASEEYFKAVKKHFKGQLLTIVFKERKAGKERVIAVHAKRARGMMVNFIIKNKINDPKSLQSFNDGGYKYDSANSTEGQWIFSRPQP